MFLKSIYIFKYILYMIFLIIFFNIRFLVFYIYLLNLLLWHLEIIITTSLWNYVIIIIFSIFTLRTNIVTIKISNYIKVIQHNLKKQLIVLITNFNFLNINLVVKSKSHSNY